jgi:hypothetical protein
MRAACALVCLGGLFAGLSPAQGAFDLAAAKQLMVQYRHQWLADPDRVRDARIGAIFDIPLVGTAVCVAVDRARVGGGYTGFLPLVVVIDRLDIVPPQLVFQPPPKPISEYKVTAAPEDARCADTPMLPFPELRNVGGRIKR